MPIQNKKRQEKAESQRKKFIDYELARKGFKYSEIDESYKFMPSRTKQQREAKKAAQIAEYKRLAKRADQRLVRLEAAKHVAGYEKIEKYAYRKAMIDIKKFFGEGANRFNRSLKDLSATQIDARIGAVLDFLNSPSSSIIGIKSVEDRRKFTFEENNPSLSWEDSLHVFERGYIEKFKRLLSSDMILKIVKVKEASQKKLDDFLKEATNNDYTSLKDTDDLLDYIGNALKKKGGKAILSEKELLNFINS